MKFQFLLAACLAFVLAAPAFGQEKTDAAANQSGVKKLESLKGKENDATALNKFFSKEFTSVMQNISAGKADAAEKTLADLETVVKGLKTEDAQAKQVLQRAKNSIPYFNNQLTVARTSEEDLKKKLAANPTDRASLNMLVQKVSMSLNTTVRSKPLQAEKKLNEFKEYIAKLAEKVEGDAQKTAILNTNRRLASFERAIKSSKKLAELVGKKAADLDVEGWVNGSPLTSEDLKGKVVLLDFWAVWCGPCIATFPHLKEWQEKYDEKDFVMIGLTRYYNFTWNDEAGRASRSKDPVEPADENKMLVKFAEHHDLHHRFAIQKKDGKLSSYYGVSGIPHVVVIDREGVIRLVRVGSGPQNAKDIAAMLEKLVKG